MGTPGNSEVEQYVQKYGEYYRGFIMNALELLDKQQSEEGHMKIDRDRYIEDLLYFSARGY